MSASRIPARALGPCVLFVLTKTACHVDGDAVATMMTTGGTLGFTGTSTWSGSDGGDISTTTTASTGTADESGTSADPTGGDPEVCAAITRDPGCGEPGAAPEGPFEVTQVSLPETFDLANACPCYLRDTPPDFEIFAPGGWPTSPTTAPLAVLAHGNGFNAGLYSNLIELLVSMGFVVLNVDLLEQLDRDEDATCALEAVWAAFGDSLRCEVILVGHSSGAGDLLDLADRSGQEPEASILRPFAVRGYVMLAAGNPSGIATLDLTAAPPAAALFFGSTTDGQVGGRPGEHFDQLAPEADAAGYSAPRAVVWVDGTTHDGFSDLGGTGRALAALQGYIPEFIRSQVFNGNDDLWWSYATTEAWPAEVLDDTLWAPLEPYSLHADVDCSIVGAGCDDTPGCASTPGGVCIDEPRIKNMLAPPSQYRHPVEFFEQIDGAEIDDTPDDMTLDVDAAEEITSGLGISRAVDSRILGVEYGAPDQVGELRIPVPANLELGEMTHLSLRAGNVLELGDVCHAVSDEPVRFDVSLARGGGIDRSVALSTGRLPQQYHNSSEGSSCPSVQAMQTVRFNLGDWCEFGTDEIDEIILTFDEPVDPARVILDTIEFTDSPLDMVEDLPPCGFTGGGDGSGMWRCEIDELTVTEVSCSAEPVGSPRACDPGDIETTAVDPPLVVLPGGSYSGWAVHTRPGMIRNLDEPTTEDLDFVLARCQQACELEYAANPDVAAECSAASGFITPSLITTDSHAAYFEIPPAQTDGSGLFEDESLDCNLRTDCCEHFDEDICANRLLRPTEARQGLGRGEEWSYGMDGIITLDSPNATEPVQGLLSGSLGFSSCVEGSGTAPCPTYIGSADVALGDPVTLELTCGGETVSHTLDSLALTLAQPAFAIRSHALPDWTAVPPGGLVFDAHTSVDSMTFDTFLPIEDGVGLMLDEGWAVIPAYGKFEVHIDVPCNGEVAEVTATFDLVATSWLGSPPEVAITVADTVDCPDTVALTADTFDAEYDLESLRWYVDDVLLDAGTTSIDVTTDHVLRAVARDARGATRSATKSVTCE